MAKLSKIIEAKKKAEAKKVALAENHKLLLASCRTSGYSEIPSEIEELFAKSDLPRLTGIVFATYAKATEATDRTTFGTEEKNQTFFNLVHQEKKPFPTCYIHYPEWANAKLAQERIKKVADVLRKRHNLELPEDVIEAIKAIDMDVPELKFDGSWPRVHNLAQLENHTFYNKCIVDHTFNTRRDGLVHAWTIYIPELDPITAMAKTLANKAKMSDELATKVATALGIEDYYGIGACYSDALTYAKNIAYYLKLQEGDTVKCLLQGELDVFIAEDGKPAVDIDDEMPAVILSPNLGSTAQIAGYLYIYLPASETQSEPMKKTE